MDKTFASNLHKHHKEAIMYVYVIHDGKFLEHCR